MKVIAVRNNKGGVGKTTMAVHIAAGLATRGARVALVDTDSQGQTALKLGLEKADSLFHVMVDKQPLEQAVVALPPESYATPDYPTRGALYLLRGYNLTYKIPILLKETDTFLFLETMHTMGELYNLDYVIIDTSPTLGLFDGAIHLATDGYIYVTECSALSFDGLNEVMGQMQGYIAQRRRYLNMDSMVVGVIPNKLRSKARLHRQNLSNLADAFPGIVWSPVILRVMWEEASQAGRTIFTYAPTGQEARDAWGIVTHVEERLQAWQTSVI